MSRILENRRLSEDFYLLKAAQANTARMGQFYMLRGWETFPVLSRPVSVFDADEDSLSFLYKVVGQGTELLSRLPAGGEITLDGPYGNGFPAVSGSVALVGGGVGIAPLYLAAKTIQKADPEGWISLYLGFSDEPVLEREYKAVCDKLTVDVGGFVTDRIDPADYDVVLTCGPDIMMRVLHSKCAAAGTPLHVSMENRMACGLGACLVCSCKTTDGNRKVCKDGPVFDSGLVYDGI